MSAPYQAAGARSPPDAGVIPTAKFETGRKNWQLQPDCNRAMESGVLT
jgi:hypothetical protein